MVKYRPYEAKNEHMWLRRDLPIVLTDVTCDEDFRSGELVLDAEEDEEGDEEGGVFFTGSILNIAMEKKKIPQVNRLHSFRRDNSPRRL